MRQQGFGGEGGKAGFCLIGGFVIEGDRALLRHTGRQGDGAVVFTGLLDEAPRQGGRAVPVRGGGPAIVENDQERARTDNTFCRSP